MSKVSESKQCVSAANLRSVLQSYSVCRFLSIFTKHCKSRALLQRDLRFGAHCVTDCFSTDFQTLFSFSDSFCLHAFVFFKTCVRHTIHTLAKSCNLDWWVTLLLKMRSNLKSKTKQKSILLCSSLLYIISCRHTQYAQTQRWDTKLTKLWVWSLLATSTSNCSIKDHSVKQVSRITVFICKKNPTANSQQMEQPCSWDSVDFVHRMKILSYVLFSEYIF